MSLRNMNKNRGWTIIQTMLALLIAGIVVSVVTNVVIDKMCEAEPGRPVCSGR